MPRDGGPLTKHRHTDRWKQQVTERRHALDRWRHIPPRPLTVLPTARRRMALLWLIATALEGNISVGSMYCPPVTEDMRWLLGKGYLKLDRRMLPLSRIARGTVLSLTESGAAAVDSHPPTEIDRQWIGAAYANNMLK